MINKEFIIEFNVDIRNDQVGAVVRFYNAWGTFNGYTASFVDYTALRRFFDDGHEEVHPARIGVTLRPINPIRDKSDRML